MKKSQIVFGIARIPIDFGLTILAFYLAYTLRQLGDFVPRVEFPVELIEFPALLPYLGKAAIAALGLVGVFALNQMYSLRNPKRLSSELIQVGFLVTAWIMLIITYYFFQRDFFFSRLVLGYTALLTAILIGFSRILMRLLQRKLAHHGIGRRKILLIGNNSLTKQLNNQFKKLNTVDIVGTTTLKKIENFKDAIKKFKPEEVIQTQENLSREDTEKLIDWCREHHIRYHFVPDILQVHRTQVDTFSIAGLPLISLKITPLEGWGKVAKRLLDIIGSGLGLLVLSPLLFLIAIAIKIDSPGPIIFCKKDDGSHVKRVGRTGKLIRFYKFRTMRHKSDSLRYTELAEKNHRKGTPLVKIKNDPRVTRFGKFLRRWSLDELPQLWSVFIGDMSLIGPRAHLPEEVNQYASHHKFVLSIKPGVSGMAQVSGRSDLDFEEEVRLDTYYIENWSILLDLKIIIKTIFVALEGKGAD